MATPFAPAGERDSALDSAMLADEALVLLDRAFEVATDPPRPCTSRQQQKATTLFQTSRYEEAATAAGAARAPAGRGAPRRCSSPRPTASSVVTARRSSSCRRSACARRALCSRRSRRRSGCGATPRLRLAAGDAAEAIYASLDMGGVNPVVSGHDVPRGRRDPAPRGREGRGARGPCPCGRCPVRDPGESGPVQLPAVGPHGRPPRPRPSR